MNPDARQFFDENPDERYWYYSSTLRVSNPRFSRLPDFWAWCNGTPEPWRIGAPAS